MLDRVLSRDDAIDEVGGGLMGFRILRGSDHIAMSAEASLRTPTGADEIRPLTAEAARHADNIGDFGHPLPLGAADAHAIGKTQPNRTAGARRLKIVSISVAKSFG